MGKKILHDSNMSSPKKDFLLGKPLMSSNQAENFLNSESMMPLSNDQKKSNKEGQNGSNQTQDNQHIEEQRQQTIVNQFDYSSMPFGNQKDQQVGISSGSNPSGDEGNSENGVHTKKDTEYLKFFRYYYEKTKKEHPNWIPSQITMIVSLLWKKKKNIEKAPSKANSTTSRRSNKPVAPKDAFRMKHKELSKQQVDELWSKLPKESKNFWKKEGNSYCTVSAKSSDVSSMKECKNSTPIYNNMRALLKNF